MLWALLATALAAQAWATYRLAIGPDEMGVRAASGLAGGALLYLLRRDSHGRGSLAATAASSAAFVLAVLVMAMAGTVPRLALGFPLLAAAAIWFGAAARGLFTTAPVQALGRWSYSIYLIHIPVLVLANRLMGEAAVQGDPAVKDRADRPRRRFGGRGLPLHRGAVDRCRQARRADADGAGQAGQPGGLDRRRASSRAAQIIPSAIILWMA